MKHELEERFYERLEEMVEELKDISTAFNPTYGGNNMREEVSRVAAALETIAKALTE